MAAIALEQTTVQQLNKIIEVVGKKSFNLVQGIKTSVAPKLNETIADTINKFQQGGLKTQNAAICRYILSSTSLKLEASQATRDLGGYREAQTTFQAARGN